MADLDLTTPGARLAWLLTTSGLSQRSLSRAAGLTASFLGAFFTRYRREPATSMLDAKSAKGLAGALGAGSAWVLWGAGDAPDAEAVSEAGKRIKAAEKEAVKNRKAEHSGDNVAA